MFLTYVRTYMIEQCCYFVVVVVSGLTGSMGLKLAVQITESIAIDHP